MFESFYNRVKSETDIRTQKQLASVLRIDPSAISLAKKRNAVPKAWVPELATIFGLNTEWLRTGRGSPKGEGVLFQGSAISDGRDPNTTPSGAWVPDGSVAALVWEHEQLLEKSGMVMEEMIPHIRSALAARANQLRVQREEESDYHVREAPEKEYGLHETPASGYGKKNGEGNDPHSKNQSD